MIHLSLQECESYSSYQTLVSSLQSTSTLLPHKGLLPPCDKSLGRVTFTRRVLKTVSILLIVDLATGAYRVPTNLVAKSMHPLWRMQTSVRLGRTFLTHLPLQTGESYLPIKNYDSLIANQLPGPCPVKAFCPHVAKSALGSVTFTRGFVIKRLILFAFDHTICVH